MGKKRQKNNSNFINIDDLSQDVKKIGKDFKEIYKKHFYKKYGYKNNYKNLILNKDGKFIAVVLIIISIFILVLTNLGLPIALILLLVSLFFLIRSLNIK